jgi:hypothetical protein
MAKKTAKKLGIKGKLRKVQRQIAKAMKPVERLRVRECALEMAVNAGRKTVSKEMRRVCKRGASRSTQPMRTGYETQPMNGYDY